MFALVAYTLLAILLTALISLSFRLYQNYSKVKNIPGSWQLMNFVKRVPIIASHFFLGSHHSMYQLTQEKGDSKTKTVRVSMLKTNLISICDRDLLKELLVAKGHNFVKEPDMYDPFNLFGVNILSALDANSETWKNHHRVANSAFSPKNLEFVALVASESVDLMRRTKWDKEIKSGSVGAGVLIDSTADFSDITLGEFIVSNLNL
ncbi:predicted protein [Naegleria gruberi]|uniref:Predicted protein n=1 Tax=Naegleria gruberi TaxID=5762 RepID=D2VJQ4_NAEGR|nr:uncharacterized protein NAEGRDRAFT_69123 [Naegleria gruberi]EFC43071.1 predicted protein [Naegleria gruberi]|eukprot:XP_002675815.1 predicted protein [Naegleria gruberi strain NEG-M]